MDLLDTQLHAFIGDDGFARLAAAFYKRVATDDILLPMYRDGNLADAELRLRDFLIQRFGGPTHYSDRRGHPRLRMRHAPFEIDLRARDRWLELMKAALGAADLPPQAHPVLLRFFDDAATFLINRAE